MTPQEQQLLQELTQKINQTTLPGKDPEAEQFLAQSLGRNPDALYILAQTVLVQNYALTQAQQQLEQLKQQQSQQQQAPQKHGSFLGNLLGMNDSPAPPPLPAQYAPVNYAPPPTYGTPQYPQPPVQYAPQYGIQSGSQSGSQSGGFLQSAMRTATGVAAGAFAFEGIESLMHGFERHAGYGGGSGIGGFDSGQPREEITNNYYGEDSGSRERDTFGDRLEANRGNDNPSPDLEDRRDDNDRSFAGDNNADASSFADSDDSIDDSGDGGNTGSSDGNSFDPGGDDTSF